MAFTSNASDGKEKKVGGSKWVTNLPQFVSLVLVSGIVEIPHSMSVPQTGTLVTTFLLPESKQMETEEAAIILAEKFSVSTLNWS